MPQAMRYSSVLRCAFHLIVLKVSTCPKTVPTKLKTEMAQ